METKCNHYHIIMYDWHSNVKATDDFIYYNDKDELTIGNTTCYNQWLIKNNLFTTSFR